MALQVSREENSANTQVRRGMNDENTFVNRECQMAVAENDRIESSRRNDVDQTTDCKAFDEMWKYVKSDTTTLDTHVNSEIANFYRKRSIFMTGASGFVGKCLLEKLLRSCPEINHIFILMRPKRGKDVSERVEALLRSELFDCLRHAPGGQRQLRKIIPVKGDITKPYFGLSNEDIELLGSRVTLVIHSAATVKFVEPLKVAVENNAVSVENLINLASKLYKLEALVHVSTAYSNCDRKRVDEVLYEAPIEAEKLIDMAQWMKPEVFEQISPTLMGKRPNTYTYTKAVAEQLLAEKSKKLLPNIPIAMVRPSIIAGIWRQPICGWVDNFNGPTGVILSMMTGAIQGMVACPDYCADIVPVDIVANLIICTAWQVHQQHYPMKNSKTIDSLEQNEHVRIYNCVSGTLNPIAWGDFAKYISQIGWVYPCNNLIGRPGALLLSNEYTFMIYNFFYHTITAYVGDFLLKLFGKKPKLVMIYQRMMKMINTLKPFTMNQWLFDCSNVTLLYDRLTPIDKEIFNFDIRQVRWDDYLRSYYIGSKIYALKDNANEVVSARRKLRRMHSCVRVTQLLFLAIIYYVFFSGNNVEEQTIESLQQLSFNVIGFGKEVAEKAVNF